MNPLSVSRLCTEAKLYHDQFIVCRAKLCCNWVPRFVGDGLEGNDCQSGRLESATSDPMDFRRYPSIEQSVVELVALAEKHRSMIADMRVIRREKE